MQTFFLKHYFWFLNKQLLSNIVKSSHDIYCFTEAHAQNELIPPHFVQEPLDSTVAEGEPHQLECQVFGNPLPLVSWFKDDVCIDYSTDYSITYNNGFCTLKIDEAHTDHQGRYTCRAVNQVGQVACSANLLVSCKYVNCSLIS